MTQVQELPSGGPSTNFLTGLRIDEYFVRKGESATTYLADALGSSIALTDDTGAIQTVHTYDPFGSTFITGLEMTNTIGFTGRDLETDDIYYYRARYYKPGIGRFLSEDPFGFKGGANLHSYVNNSPVNFIDPLGLVAWTCQYAVGTVNKPIGLGGGAFGADCTSECVAGVRVKASLVGSMVGVSGGPLPGGFAASEMTLNDTAKTPDARNLEGRLLYAAVGGAAGAGIGWTWLELGAAKGNGFGPQIGLDFGADSYAGSVALTSSRNQTCCPE